MHQVDSAIAAQNQANTRSQSYWANAIRDSWQKSAAGIFETGKLLRQAHDELDRDVFNAMKLPFGIRTRQMLMRVAAHPVLANHGSQLPPCWRTMYELTKLPNDILLARLEDGTINPGMERKDASALLNKPKKPQIASKPNLLVAWAAATPTVRRLLFDRIGAKLLLCLISSNVRAELTELLERQLSAKAAAGSSAIVSLLKPYCTMSVALQTALSWLKSIDEPTSSEIVRKANVNQLLTALRTLNTTVRAAGSRKEPAITIIEAGTIEALRNPHKKKRRAA